MQSFYYLSMLYLLLSCQQVPQQPDVVFYIPGGIVLEMGGNPVSEYYGPYAYTAIVDTLRGKGLSVISEVTPGADDSVYVNRIVAQIDSLVANGHSPSRIAILGASQGAHIACAIAQKLQHPDVHYALLGMCRETTWKKFVDQRLPGHFLSIIEASDPHGTCSRVFEAALDESSFNEITLHMGNSHGFLYQPHPEWVNPFLVWLQD